MAGHQMLGAGVELTPGKWRLGVVGGRFRRATGIDTTVSNLHLPMFRRTGFAAKAGYGTERSFVDIVYFRATDDANSLSALPTDSNTAILPGSNSSVSLRGQLQATNNIQFYADAGLSIVNRNVTAQEVDVNDHFLWKVIGQPNIATQVYYAIESGTNISAKGHYININYKRIAPDYQSYAAYFIENDINAINFRHSFAIWKNRVAVNYGMGMFNDNLLNRKQVKTIRYQPMIGLSINPAPKWGIDLNWMDVFTQQEEGLQPVNDTLRMNNRNPGLTITPRFNWGNTNAYHMIMLSYMNMRMIDRNAFTAIYAEYASQIINLMYNLSLGQKGQSFNMAINRTQNKTTAFDETGYGGSAGYSQTWKEGRINANGSIGMQFSDVNTNITFNTGGNYNLTAKQTAGLMLTYLVNRTTNVNSRNFSEFTGVVSYTLNF
jgi:hypothetical protein